VSTGDVEAKLAAIRRAAKYRFPIEPDVEKLLTEMETSRLAEIEAGTHGMDFDRGFDSVAGITRLPTS
jgi:hypothetical protein